MLEELEAFSKLGRDVVLRREEDCEDAACVDGWTDGRDRVSKSVQTTRFARR